MLEKKTAFMVDSGCEPTQAFLQTHNLEFVGMNIMLDGKRYVEESNCCRSGSTPA